MPENPENSEHTLENPEREARRQRANRLREEIAALNAGTERAAASGRAETHPESLKEQIAERSREAHKK